MRASDLVYLPPHILAERFAASPPDEEEPEEEVRDLDYERDVEPYLMYLPPRDADVVELYFRRGIKQPEIARILGVSQPAVSFALSRSLARIKNIVSLAHITEPQACADLAGLVSVDEVKLLLVIVRVRRWDFAQRLLGITRGVMRHRWLRIQSVVGAAQGERFDVYRKLVALAPRRRKKKRQ